MKKNIKISIIAIAIAGINILFLSECRNSKSSTESEDYCLKEMEQSSPMETEQMAEIVGNMYSEGDEEMMVECKACGGLGHNSYEVNGNKCTVCDGQKKLKQSLMQKRYEKWLMVEIPCNICNGTGESYIGRVTPLKDRDMMASSGYYTCKVCKGKKKGTRAELINNFKVANEVYGPAL